MRREWREREVYVLADEAAKVEDASASAEQVADTEASDVPATATQGDANAAEAAKEEDASASAEHLHIALKHGL